MTLTEEELDWFDLVEPPASWCKDDMWKRLLAAARQSIEAKEFLIDVADGNTDGNWMQWLRVWLDQNAPDWSNVKCLR